VVFWSVLHEVVELALETSDIASRPEGAQVLFQGLVEPFHLAAGGRVIGLADSCYFGSGKLFAIHFSRP
jgi:hypothetical protein